MDEIKIDSFAGGKNEFDYPALIADNECVSGTVNVWAPQKVLTKVPGYSTEYVSVSATANALVSMYVDTNVNQSYALYARLSSSVTNPSYYPWAEGTVPLGYTNGSVSISGSPKISATGSSTAWLTHVAAGDLFRVDATGSNWFSVASVEDNTHLTLNSAIPANVAGASYTIMPGMTRAEITWASLNGSWWSSTTADIMQSYSGAQMFRVSSAPKAAFLSVFQNYLFAARASTAESRLYWSTIQDPTSWPVNNFIDIDKAKGKITGLIAYGNELIVFKNRGMYKVTGSVFDPSNPTYAVYPIAVPNYFQHNSNFAAAIHKGILYFYAYGQLFTYVQGTFSIQQFSKKFLTDLPNTFGFAYDLATSEQRVHAISFNDYFIIKGMQYFTGAKTSAGILDQNGAWWFARGVGDSTSVTLLDAVNMVVLPGNSSNKPRLLVGSNGNPHIMVWDFLSYGAYDTNFFDPNAGASTSIQSTWLSKEFNIEYGTFKWVVIYLAKQSAGNLTFSWSIDQGSFVDNTIDMTVGRGNIIRSTLNINQKGTSIQFKIVNTNASQTFQIYAIKCFYELYTENRQL